MMMMMNLLIMNGCGFLIAQGVYKKFQWWTSKQTPPWQYHIKPFIHQLCPRMNNSDRAEVVQTFRATAVGIIKFDPANVR